MSCCLGYDASSSGGGDGQPQHEALPRCNRAERCKQAVDSTGCNRVVEDVKEEVRQAFHDILPVEHESVGEHQAFRIRLVRIQDASVGERQ